MNKIEVSPLSINACYRGRRFKTPEYKAYETELYYKLPKMKVPEGELRIDIEAGLANTQSDIDNIAKPFIDICQKKYGFNDRWIMELHMKKVKTKKGKEYIKFLITPICPNKH